MRSFKIELLRFGSDRGYLNDRYLVAADGAPVRTVEPKIEQAQLFQALAELRYREESTRQLSSAELASVHAKRDAAVAVLRSLVADFLQDLPDDIGLGATLEQIDIVTDKVELWALPFEFAQKGGRDLLVDPRRNVLLTRRVRRSSDGATNLWPECPRVLFAWFGDVQHDEHRTALYKALEPWIGPLDEGMVPDPRGVFTELKSASLEAIAQECERAAAGDAPRPYTHVHLLAHGAVVPGVVNQLDSFGVSMKDGVCSAEQLTQALRADAPTERPTVITLAVCDSSNAMNAIVAGGRVAYELHARGVPVVIGSQFPLTQAGALVFAQCFYRTLLADASDVRLALCKARSALRSSELIGHDWASITAHVSIPENYLEQIRRATHRVLLAQLRTVSKWAQKIVEDGAPVSPETVERVETLLEERIEALEMQRGLDRSGPPAERNEILGLLGSARKRYAELVAREPTEAAQRRSRAALQAACDSYLEAHELTLANHWTGTQHLAITAAIHGSIPAEQSLHWLAACQTARREALGSASEQDTLWALGSLAELYLLASCLAQPLGPLPAFAEARRAIETLIVRANEASMSFVIDSTWRQIRRYVHWWTNGNGFFPGRLDLSQDAQQLEVLLNEHVDR